MPDVLRDPTSTSNPTLSRPFGIQSTRGVVHLYVKRGLNTYFILLLGVGEVNGEGWLDGIEWFRYGGRLLNPYNAATGLGDYIFHPGKESTGFADAVQGRPTF